MNKGCANYSYCVCLATVQSSISPYGKESGIRRSCRPLISREIMSRTPPNNCTWKFPYFILRSRLKSAATRQLLHVLTAYYLQSLDHANYILVFGVISLAPSNVDAHLMAPTKQSFQTRCWSLDQWPAIKLMERVVSFPKSPIRQSAFKSKEWLLQLQDCDGFPMVWWLVL